MNSAPTRPGRGPILVLLALLLAAGPLLVTARPARAAVTFVVNRLDDRADPKLTDDRCDVDVASGDQCTLRAAIQQANATTGPDTIRFAIPDNPAVPGDEVRSIRPRSALPAITQRLTLDGSTQPGSTPNTLANAAKGTDAVLMIELDGTNAGIGATGLTIDAPNVLVRGLAIGRFAADGVAIRSGATGTRIAGCFVGTDAGGATARGNGGEGIVVNAEGVTIGGPTAAARNLVSGNGHDGIDLDAGAAGARVLGNLIGTDRTGAAPLGNGDGGVGAKTASADIGGDAAAGANVIAFNAESGVDVDSDDDGNPPGVGIRILRNSVFANAGLGIDLGNDGPTPNDPGDFDRGANSLQNAPAVASATSGRVRGTLHSTPRATFTIRVFSSPSGDEGKTFRGGPVQVTTDASGNGAFSVPTTTPIPRGHRVTATATGADGTSEFSTPPVAVP